VSDPAGETRNTGAGPPDGAGHEAAAGTTVADLGASVTAPAAAGGGFDGSALRWLWLSLGVLVLDQLTKALIVAKFRLYERIDVLPVLEITRLHNYGAAFSLLHDAGGWQHYFFVSLALLVSVGLVVWLGRLRFRANAMLASGLALILGGALGNVIDRLIHGHVVDFIHFHWYERWYFPAFNVADTAITIGAGLLILDSLLESRRAATTGAT
jgi:signal peptidase II